MEVIYSQDFLNDGFGKLPPIVAGVSTADAGQPVICIIGLRGGLYGIAAAVLNLGLEEQSGVRLTGV